MYICIYVRGGTVPLEAAACFPEGTGKLCGCDRSGPVVSVPPSSSCFSRSREEAKTYRQTGRERDREKQREREENRESEKD